MPHEGPPVGPGAPSPEQNAQHIRRLLENLYRGTYPDGTPISPLILEQMGAELEEWSSHTPDSFTNVARDVATSFGFVSADAAQGASAGEIVNALLSGVESALSGSSRDRIVSSFNNIRETIRTTVGETTSRDVEQRTTGQERTEITTGRRVMRFVDVPTPEEFLNDFSTALSAYSFRLVRDGEIDQNTADFMMQNQELFLDRYLGSLTEMIARGEDIFRVVGVEGEPEFLGERIGGATEEVTSGTRTEDTSTETETREGTVREGTTETDRTTESEATTEGGETLPESGKTTERTDFETKQLTAEEERLRQQREEQFETIQREFETEAVFRRPNIATVFRLSPLAFLGKQFTGQSVNLLAAGRRGTRQRQAETAAGGFVSGVRRT